MCELYRVFRGRNAVDGGGLQDLFRSRLSQCHNVHQWHGDFRSADADDGSVAPVCESALIIAMRDGGLTQPSTKLVARAIELTVSLQNLRNDLACRVVVLGQTEAAETVPVARLGPAGIAAPVSAGRPTKTNPASSHAKSSFVKTGWW